MILWDRFDPARVTVKDVATPIVQFDFVIVLAGMAAVKETVLVPTSASPLNVVQVIVPEPLALFVATYWARDVGTVHETLVLVVFVVMVPEPLPKVYVSECVKLDDARAETEMVRVLPMWVSEADVVGTVGGICAMKDAVEVPIAEPPLEEVYVLHVIVPDARIEPEATCAASDVGTVHVMLVDCVLLPIVPVALPKE